MSNARVKWRVICSTLDSHGHFWLQVLQGSYENTMCLLCVLKCNCSD
uniref:Uncharacterized protein n=1 Tax=Anguilla anguilla TaxID=7936 RepID=A0A0E9PPW3_ANGAN